MKKGHFVWFFLSPIFTNALHYGMHSSWLQYCFVWYSSQIGMQKIIQALSQQELGSKHTSIMFTQWCGDGFFIRPAGIYFVRIYRKVRGSIVIKVEHYLTATESRLDCDGFCCWFHKPASYLSTWWPVGTCCKLWLSRST